MQKQATNNMEKLIGFTREITWLSGIDHGWGNGYVAVPKSHVTYGVHYNEIDFISVHGGLTYSNEYQEWMPKEVEGMWIFGFDTAHYQDSPETCPKEYVEAEVESLKEQLNKVKKHVELKEHITYTI